MEQAASGASPMDGGHTVLVPAGETEFARDAAFGYRSSNLVEWIREKSATSGEGELVTATERVVSISLQDLREGGPVTVRKRLTEARGGCVVVNAVEERDLQVKLCQRRYDVI